MPPGYAIDGPLVLALGPDSALPDELGCVERGFMDNGHLEVASCCRWYTVWYVLMIHRSLASAWWAALPIWRRQFSATVSVVSGQIDTQPPRCLSSEVDGLVPYPGPLLTLSVLSAGEKDRLGLGGLELHDVVLGPLQAGSGILLECSW